jgi:HPt (histidine-containing phosphotransfer) domain-containing protein
MHPHVDNLLKKISFIETDMELHKQILVTIPSDQKDDLEQVMQNIADKKQEIQDLRREIKRLDHTA